MATTFCVFESTNTYEAPCCLTHLTVQSFAPAFAPLAPQALSLIQPVQESPLALALEAMPAANSNAAAIPRIFLRFFMRFSPKVWISDSPGLGHRQRRLPAEGTPVDDQWMQRTRNKVQSSTMVKMQYRGGLFHEARGGRENT